MERHIRTGARRAAVVGAGYIDLAVSENLLARGLQVKEMERLDAP